MAVCRGCFDFYFHPTLPNQKRALLKMRLQINLLHLFYAWLIDQRRLIAPELLLNLLRDLVSIPLSTTGMNGLVTGSSASGNGFTTAGTAGSSSLSLPPVAVFLLVKRIPSHSIVCLGMGIVRVTHSDLLLLINFSHFFSRSSRLSSPVRYHQHMASFLDVVYRSDEKDRVPAFLTGILANIFPYLRVRTHSNSSCFTAASKLLASVSSYQYTRRSWRREVLELFFEPMFFQMSLTALHSWNIIIDNLMTQDKNTFREALSTFSVF
ncbi:hypothetical protein AHF37_07099 [Paragonimus kellicotti]|nr:hypothetical protein AHF37_07099 [Paragonimus kellicotti]